MIGTNELDIWLSEKLKPLRAELECAGIPVSLLPLEASDFSRNSAFGIVSVAVPQILGQEPDSVPPGYCLQDLTLTYEIVITIMTSKRYRNQDKQKNSLEQITEGVLTAILGESPPLPKVITPLWLVNYQLLQPDGKKWIANLTIRFTRMAPIIPENERDYSKYKLRLQLIADQPEIPPETLIKEWEITPQKNPTEQVG
ncbi:hypothetical protein [Moorena sp. SIO3A2]|uniref:hypothetical protein n=1 Tax=Moorena sp. SIO3A2 TaxID=2607841 RepID=UPI0013B85A10|nr:hypothetical protein [Moorena sp. SIO3A2]NER90377.1 hypothetical protein [Moorena sp. SIO3A2]